jgi:hypothetical protein
MRHGEALEALGPEARHLPERRGPVHAQPLEHPQHHDQIRLRDGVGNHLVHQGSPARQHRGHVLPPVPPRLARQEVEPRLDPLAQCRGKLMLVAEARVRLPRIQQRVDLPHKSSVKIPPPPLKTQEGVPAPSARRS